MKPLKIVAIGGGTGLSILLRGLKKISSDITAIVSVADDGGGSGVLRADLGMLPPGDIRSCILSLANTEPIMEDLIRYRFTEGRLKGQNFGNLLIAALVGVTGSFESAVERISDIVAITGKVLPVARHEVTLVADLSDGRQIEGESAIPLAVLETGQRIEKIHIKEKPVQALGESIRAIEQADIVLLGPGSLYTSVIPNLLIEGISEALSRTNGLKIYISNLMTQPGETEEHDFYDHINQIISHGGKNIVDWILANDAPIEESILTRYASEGAVPLYPTNKDKVFLKRQGLRIKGGSFVEVFAGYVRHDCDAIAQSIMEIVEPKRKEKMEDTFKVLTFAQKI